MIDLGRLRFPAGASRGRRYPELPHPYRAEFQRDRDRIVHSRAFRRLENKTQVFTPALSDHFRNRLTHTIEVAQIARTVAGVLRLDEDLTEALALAHDIGHPPFAHAGEEELNRQMSRFSDHFDHNIHALRIVETFEQRYARFPGLNLTFEVREGLVKHSHDLAEPCAPELRGYLPGLRPPLEAQLIDLADEIAYNTADLDDAFSAGIFTIDDIRGEVPLYASIAEAIETQFPGSPERIQFHEALRLLIDSLVSGLIAGTADACGQAGVADSQAVRTFPTRLARFTETSHQTSLALKHFLGERVYFSAPLAVERERSSQMIAELFQFFVSRPDRMPEPYAQASAGNAPHRVVCDYIAGMTDRFLVQTHCQMLG